MSKKVKEVGNDEIDLDIASGAAAQITITGELVAPAEKVTAMAASLGYDGSLSAGALEDGIRFYQHRTVESLLEMGKRLLLLKEITPHGEFAKRVELLGFAERTARRFMQASAKTAKLAVLADLSTQVKSVSAFLELITHDEDALKEIAEFDDIDRLSASELRARVRILESEGSEDIKALKRREKNLDAELERAQLQLKKLSTAKPRATEFLDRTEDIRAECVALQMEAELPINSLLKLFEEVNAEDVNQVEWHIQMEQIWVTAHVVAARALDMIERIKDHVKACDEMPTRVMGQHILLPAEAERWLLDSAMIVNKHEAEKSLRQAKRDEAKPKGRGRPSGSKNKVGEE